VDVPVIQARHEEGRRKEEEFGADRRIVDGHGVFLKAKAGEFA
jgi:hypothetical protein